MSLLRYDDAISQLLHAIQFKPRIEQVPLLQAQNRILAEPLRAKHDAPPFDNSAMDGYALCGLTCQSWVLIDTVAAGDETHHLNLQSGQAVRILTGAAVPEGTEAVLAQEDAVRTEALIESQIPLKLGQNIRKRAEEFSQNDVLIAQDQPISPITIGVAASQGLSHIACYRAVRVSVFSTGDELQEPGQVLQENQIYDSNRYLLLSYLQKNQAYRPTDGGALPDQLAAIEYQLEQAAKQSDAIIISGGASVGDKDFTHEALRRLGQINFWKLAIKPGKPFAWGYIANTPVFVLPGNPVASWLTYLILVLPALCKLAGLSAVHWQVEPVTAIATSDVLKPQKRQQYLRGFVTVVEGQLQAHIFAQQGSAMLASCIQANALIVVPPEEIIHKGDVVQVLCLTDI